MMVVAMPVVTAPMPFTIKFLSPMRSLLGQPTADHAGLREREGDEHADGIQRNQGVGVTVEDDKQKAGERPLES